MKKDIFQLRSNTEFIELIKLLKIMGIAQTGGHAKMIIEDGLICVNGEIEYRKRKKLRIGDTVGFEDIEIGIINEENGM